jgi:hypothetical protein
VGGERLELLAVVRSAWCVYQLMHLILNGYFFKKTDAKRLNVVTCRIGQTLLAVNPAGASAARRRWVVDLNIGNE